MKVISIQNNMNFRADPYYTNEPLLCGAYDEETSSVLDRLRRDFFPETTYYSGCPSDNLDTQRATDRFLKSLSRRTDYRGVENEIMRTIPLKYIEKLRGSDNSYRGASPVTKPEVLAEMKKAGIERVVNLAEDKIIQHCRKYGLEGFDYDLYKYVNFSYQGEMFKTDIDAAKEVETKYRGYGAEFISSKIKETLGERNKTLDSQLAKFVEFINFMKHDNLYIGCEWGNNRTSIALTLNHFFNPNASEMDSYIDDGMLDKASVAMLNLCKNLRPEHKKAMGWPENYETRLVERLQKLPKHLY